MSEGREIRCFETKREFEKASSHHRNQTQGTWCELPVLCHLARTTRHHQPPQSSAYTAQVLLNVSVATWQPLSTWRQNSIDWVDWKIISIRRKLMLSGFLSLETIASCCMI